MVDYNVDVEEFNTIVGDVICEESQKWAEKLTIIKLDSEKNAMMVKNTDHYKMLMDALEKTQKMPDKLFYTMDEPYEEREEKIRKFARVSAFGSYRRSMSKDMLDKLIVNFDKDKNAEKGFNNFINSFFVNKKVFDYLYTHSAEFAEFSDNINDTAILDKFYEARENKEFQKKVEGNYNEERLNSVIEDPLFKDVCILCVGACIFHNPIVTKG